MHALIVITVMFLISSLFVLVIRPSGLVKKTSRIVLPKSVIAEIKSTIGVIVKVKNLFHALSLLALAQILIFIIAVIGPGYARHVLGIRINEFPLLFVTPAVIGMGIGTFALSNYFHHHKKELTATAGLILMSLTLFLLPYGSKV